MRSLCKTNFLLIISCFVIGKLCLEEEKDVVGHPVINTKLGPVRGNTHVVLNSSVHVFWGIPFAKPPIGKLRFKHPVRADSWNGTLDGTRKPNACFQIETEATWTLSVPESEDCLNLNVFVPGTLAPTNASNSNVTGLSVMFFMFGGGFVRGTTTIDRYNSSMLAVTGDVIVVTVSYRLGAFGYLFSGSPEAPGNAGIFDQLMALQWVHDNIECFGGDPGSVTIFGGSAGAFSAGLLILSPLSHGLFQRAIIMSGAPTSFVGLSTSMGNSFSIIDNLGNFTGCNRSNNYTSIREIVACLKIVTAETLDVAQESFVGYYRPVLDGHLLPNRVTNLYHEVVRKNISVILGVTQNEGSMFLSYLMNHEFENSENISVSHQVLQHMISGLMLRFHFNAMQKDAISYIYGNWEDIYDNEANRQIACDLSGDFMFVCPTNEFGHQLSDRNLDVYYYMFDHRPSKTPWPEWAGVAHGDDIFFIFGHPLESANGYSAEEARLSYRIIKAFGNFAKFGVPSYEEVSWPRYNRDNQTYMTIKINGDVIKKGPRANHCAIWNGLLHKLIEKDDSCNKDEIVAKRMMANRETDSLEDTAEE